MLGGVVGEELVRLLGVAAGEGKARQEDLRAGDRVQGHVRQGLPVS
ncbi:hypothetical protein [Streptomyces eurythermus]